MPMARSDFKFSFPLRVRYAECDMQGIVFNSRYFEYLDVGITEYYRAVGIRMGAPDSPEFHVVRNTCDYAKPLLMDEEFDVCLRLARTGRSSMTTFWEIHGRGADDLRTGGETVNVHVGEVRGAPAPLPADLIAKFEHYEGVNIPGKSAT